jgi:hypothetical protein
MNSPVKKALYFKREIKKKKSGGGGGSYRVLFTASPAARVDIL